MLEQTSDKFVVSYDGFVKEIKDYAASCKRGESSYVKMNYQRDLLKALKDQRTPYENPVSFMKDIEMALKLIIDDYKDSHILK